MLPTRKQSFPKNDAGFTLIELVVVIVILSIITVIATSKFVDFSRDAQISQLHGIAADLNSQNQLVYSKSSVASIETLIGCSFQCGGHLNWDVSVGEYFVDVSGTRLYVSLGYPLPPMTSSEVVNQNYRTAFGLPTSEFVFTSVPRHLSATAIVPIKWQDKLADIKAGKFECHVEYSSPTAIRDYGVRVYDRDC
ncbi:prepilin-type N-terminal cleavage/methylation domain-containing protein [Shewanella sp. 125m-7]